MKYTYVRKCIQARFVFSHHLRTGRFTALPVNLYDLYLAVIKFGIIISVIALLLDLTIGIALVL